MKARCMCEPALSQHNETEFIEYVIQTSNKTESKDSLKTNLTRKILRAFCVHIQGSR